MKDELGLELADAFSENRSLESLNIESNELTNESLEPLFNHLETHVNIREFKCAHQKAGLGSRGEEAMARAIERNENLLKIGYPFAVPSARSVVDRSQVKKAFSCKFSRVLIFAHSGCAKFENFRADLFSRTLNFDNFRAD